MTVLRLTQLGPAADGHLVEIALEGRGVRRTATATVATSMSDIDQARLRWYLEDYPERSADPAPQVAAGVERRMAEIGRSLFSSIFEGNRDAARLWSDVCDEIADVRIEISAGIRETHAIPWELLRDPRTNTPLALSAAEFVRVQSQVARAPRPPEIATGPARILMAICRPEGANDVPFRSVAIHIVKALTEAGAAAVDLDVLRPPTFAALGRALRRAKEDGRPYHAVHFDGHGLYVDDKGLVELQPQYTFDPRQLSAPSAQRVARGYICFEDDDHPSRIQAVDGAAVGDLLYETRVPTLVLNACRSGLGSSGSEATSEATVDDDASTAPLAQENQVRAYGSFAQSVVDAGVLGVVAMRYNVYVATAAQFVGEFYQTLAQGQTLGRAATRARKHLGDERTRHVAGEPVELQDWPVPAIYEAAPISLFPKRDVAAPLFDETDWTATRARVSELPRQPDVGFVGRDETLLALDRAFDRHSIVLLHAYAGSGKTATAAEFARWYSVTGGIDGPLLFSSFEQRLPLPRLLDRIGTEFSPVLEAHGVPWLTLDDDKRRFVAIELLRRNPVFWVWDNVEPVAGFPVGAESAWNGDEQAALLDFLRDMRNTKAKVLLTSRRDENGWLGDLPIRVRVPPMPKRDRRLLAAAIVQRSGIEMRTVEALTPLLDFSQGNPMTLNVVVRQALQDGVSTREAADAMAARLRDGEQAFDDDEEQGRSRSLGASLAYGFDSSFQEADRRRLALLHLFQGVADINILAHIEAVGQKEDGERGAVDTNVLKQEWAVLLNRAADIGLLTALGSPLFSVHPALPWYFNEIFKRAYPGGEPNKESSRTAIEQVFSEVIIGFCALADKDGQDQSLGLAITQAHELNLLHARRLAEHNGGWTAYLEATRLVTNFYRARGRRLESRRLTIATIERLVDPTTMTPREGLEEYWLEATSLAHTLSCDELRPADADRLFGLIVDHVEKMFGSSISDITSEMIASNRSHAATRIYLHAVRMQIGNVVERKAADDLEKAANLGEIAYDLALRLNATMEIGPLAMHIGHCYCDMKRSEDNLKLAQQWYERCLSHTDATDLRRISMCKFELAQIRYGRFQCILHPDTDVSVLQTRLNEALSAAIDAERTQPDDYPQIKIQLTLLIGNILDDGGYYSGSKDMQDKAAVYYEKAIQLAESTTDELAASTACREMARLKAKMQEFDDALIYAQSALSRAERLGQGGAQSAARSRELIEGIKLMGRQRQ